MIKMSSSAKERYKSAVGRYMKIMYTTHNETDEQVEAWEQCSEQYGKIMAVIEDVNIAYKYCKKDDKKGIALEGFQSYIDNLEEELLNRLDRLDFLILK